MLIDRLKEKNMDVYWVGGAPCAGKSTIVEDLALKNGFVVFHTDDYMFPHMAKAVEPRHSVMCKQRCSSWDDMFMRPVDLQVQDEFEFYREEFDMLADEILALSPEMPVIAEGNALLPELMAREGIGRERLIYLVPSREFQFEHYARRSFKDDILKTCKDPQQAFQNWMDRDAAFAEQVASMAGELGMEVIRVDGKTTLQENLQQVENHFGFYDANVP